LTIRDNVVARMSGVGIRVNGFTGSGNPYIIERNYVHTTTDNGIQVEGEVTVQNNLVLDSLAYDVYSGQATYAPNLVNVFNNTLVCGAGTLGGLHATQWDVSTGQIVGSNAIYCPASAAVLVAPAPTAFFALNFALGTSDAAAGVTNDNNLAADLGDPSTTMLYPPDGSALINTGAVLQSAPDDFNGTKRDFQPDVGAYEHTTATNPGWQPVDGFKPLPVTPCGP
jgi:hypothetical protein